MPKRPEDWPPPTPKNVAAFLSSGPSAETYQQFAKRFHAAALRVGCVPVDRRRYRALPRILYIDLRDLWNRVIRCNF